MNQCLLWADWLILTLTQVNPNDPVTMISWPYSTGNARIRKAIDGVIIILQWPNNQHAVGQEEKSKNSDWTSKSKRTVYGEREREIMKDISIKMREREREKWRERKRSTKSIHLGVHWRSQLSVLCTDITSLL